MTDFPAGNASATVGNDGDGDGGDRLTRAARIVRGARRALAERGYRSLGEVRLKSGRRVDVLGVNSAGDIVIIEVKSSVADFRADQKWPEYRDFCDSFYFAVGDDFPLDLIPEDCGLMVADAYGAAVLREPPMARLNAARRKGLILDLALAASGRLHRIEDPLYEPAGSSG